MSQDQNFSDEEIIRVFRVLQRVLSGEALTKKQRKDMQNRLGAFGAALLLARYAHESQVGRATFDFSDVVCSGDFIGNWRIVVEKVNEDSTPDVDSVETNAPHTLAGELYPEKVQQAIDCFKRLVYIKGIVHSV